MTTTTRCSGLGVGLIPIAAVLLVSLGGCGDDGNGSRSTPTSTPTIAPTPTATALANQPPVLAPIGDRTVAVGDDLLIALSAVDPEGQPVAFSISSVPSNAYFLPASGVFCIFESSEAPPIQITFRASDGELSDEETITIRTRHPAIEMGEPAAGLSLDPIGNHSVRAGQTLTLQLAASGAQPITYKMFPEAALAPLVTLDAASGRFQFTPTGAQVGKELEITFQACVPDGAGCSATAQTHETVYLSVEPASPSCPDYIPPGCLEITPGMPLPSLIGRPLGGSSCVVIRQAGSAPYVGGNVNIINGGALYIEEDPGKRIDIQVNSLLVEQNGVLQAGSPDCPFGAKGGKLSIGLYGDDPSMQATVPNPPPGIQCRINQDGNECFSPARDPHQGSFYCTVSDSSDPCSATMPPQTDPNNTLLEHYGNLNFDPTPWGYKVLGVSYGGSLRLFGYKGAKPLQDTAWAAQYDSDQHCAVPSPQQSTLGAAEMQAWADLSGSSWARLQQISPDRLVLVLDRVVSDWAPGDQIVVGTTDWYPSHSEVRTIRSISTVGTSSHLVLCRPTQGGTGPGGCADQRTAADALDYPHFSELFDAAALNSQHGAEYTGPVNRSAADLRAPVGLLSRSIQIRSLGAMPQMQSSDPGFPDVADCLYGDGTLKPECYFGGHVMIRQGFRAAQFQGVEFKQLGQGGRIGHYPVHFHLAKSTAYTGGQAFLKDSAVWDSMTRFVTLHGTHDVTLARNVGYLSVGHGYYLEDGSEIQNLLCHNLGVSARGALKEYFSAAGDEKNWLGSPPAPSLAARYVPPILDGSNATPDLQPAPTLRLGSDTYMPVMYWSMNAYNEFVGNAAAGVHGFGSCFWLLGSGVSGPSVTHKFDGYAGYNRAGQYQAPLLRFRGNSCSTATYGLSASAEMSPAPLGDARNTGYTPVDNPYIAGKTVAQLMGNYARPAVVDNFKPIPITAESKTCAQSGPSDAELQKNTQSCVTTVIDRFTTSYNWAQANYGSVWLRAWFYLLLNSAVTDQLFGGVTFVSAGSWVQVPPAYFSLAKNSLFVGTSQHGGSKYAQRSGPLFQVTTADNLARYAPCDMGGHTTCNLLAEGTGFWTGGFQPKRLINIYDGPHFADGNLFVNVGSWECDPQPCMSQGTCETTLPCGIYSATTQPVPSDADRPIDPHKMIVLDAAVGWKQPNAFYYPPAFTYRGSTFFKKLPSGLPDPDPANPLNQCFSFGPEDGYMKPHERPGDCRHYVIDRTRNYIRGSMLALNGGPGVFPAADNTLPTTPVDFSTILIDLDGTLTGAEGMISGVSGAVPSTSLSRNAFFDAPAQTEECLSFGLQTSPYAFVTTLIAPLLASPATSDPTAIDAFKWKRSGDSAPDAPLVAIYRQWENAGDPETCGQICSESAPTKYGCTRGAFMMGANVGQSPYLTMAEPPGLMSQPGALYYIDTSTGAKQPIDCVTARVTTKMLPAPFAANDSYVLYNLFAKNDAVQSYQLYVGDGVNDLAAIKGRYVRVLPHVHHGASDFNSTVQGACDPSGGSGWCANLPVPTVQNGLLTVVLDQRGIAGDYAISGRQDYERCMPRDLCYFDSRSKRCESCTNDASQCIRQSDFLAIDVQSMNQTDATGKMPLDIICQDWATFSGGTTSDAPGALSLIDCPANGCLGFAFTLPANFVGDKTYQEVGAPLARCFRAASWMDNALDERMSMGKPADPLCGPPRPAVPADFCADPSLDFDGWVPPDDQ